MKSVTIRKEWYDEVKDSIELFDPYEYEEDGITYVEANVADLQEFIQISTHFGWL